MARRRKKSKLGIVSLFLIISILVYNTYYKEINNKVSHAYNKISQNYNSNIPEYEGNDYLILNDNKPTFDIEKYQDKEFENYSELDSLGRCGPAFANISKKTMPTKNRESIGMIKPSGWHTIKYDHIDGKYLYNRCHLIAYQLAGENANLKNLITCTRHMNTKSMLKYENKVAKYVKQTNNHVLYKVTPIFDDLNLLAKGVIIEAYSVEDNGKGISFNVFVYNHQKGIEIDYKTGESKLKNNYK